MHKLLIILLTVCLFPSMMQGGEAKFANRKLRQLAELMPAVAFPDRDTIVEVPQVVKEKSLVFTLNEKKEITHMGVSLFSNETKQMVDRGICNFLERCFLELLLQKDGTAAVQKLQEYHLTLTINGQPFGTGRFRSVASLLQAMQMPVNFTLQCADKQAEAVWTCSGYNLHLTFPLYRELIEGSDKKESDDELYNLLQDAVHTSVSIDEQQVTREELQPQTGNIYVRKGNIFMIEPLSSDQYYAEENGRFVPLYQEQYPEYSMNNLFLTFKNGEGKTLQITHRKYGHFTPEISIPLLNFLTCFQKDFQTACHTGYNRKGELETIVVFNHKKLDYIHMLRVHIDKEQLFADHPVMKADFYSNIPQHYIKSLLK